MPLRIADAVWNGTLKEGHGFLKSESGIIESNYSFNSRFSEGSGTNPEELIGAAHAGCFSMELSRIIEKEGFTPKQIRTSARVQIDPMPDGFQITRIELFTEGNVPGVTPQKFDEMAEYAKQSCPVSKALKSVPVSLSSKLV